jgi:hypothetical protein
MQLQKLVPIRQNFPDRRLPDLPGGVRDAMQATAWTQAVKPGSRIAVGVGSRGITNIDVIAKAVVDFWKSRDCKPFIIPVMGSHGAATGPGQADVLAHYGITEETMDCPIVSSLDVEPIGTTPDGVEVVMAKDALAADGVMLCARVKWHTDFEGTLESGIHKMMAIGLGKWAGAQRYHTHGLKLGLERVIRTVGEVVLGTGKMLGGLAILEDAHHSTAEVHAVGAAGMVEEEEKLLARVKSWKPNIPVKELDILIVDEIGKNFSGAGMDTKVINRSGRRGPNVWDGVPTIHRVFARDLSPLSYGNAVGIGLCDVIADRLYKKIDFEPTWINSLTASSLTASYVPLHFANDRTCIEKIAPTCGKLDVSDVSIAWIRNTMDLSELLISANLLDEVRRNPEIEVLGEPIEIEYDSNGDLVGVLEAEAVAH